MVANRRCGSNASVELSWHVGFTPDFGVWLRRRNWRFRANRGNNSSLEELGAQVGRSLFGGSIIYRISTDVLSNAIPSRRLGEIKSLVRGPH
jgi:hypothetical protein